VLDKEAAKAGAGQAARLDRLALALLQAKGGSRTLLMMMPLRIRAVRNVSTLIMVRRHDVGQAAR
jgi:hypothetical protein